MIQQHDFTGGKGCVHCGATSPEQTCITRSLAPQSSARPSSPACDDFDAIHARLQELRAEADAALTRADETPTAEPAALLLSADLDALFTKWIGHRRRLGL